MRRGGGVCIWILLNGGGIRRGFGDRGGLGRGRGGKTSRASPRTPEGVHQEAMGERLLGPKAWGRRMGRVV